MNSDIVTHAIALHDGGSRSEAIDYLRNQSADLLKIGAVAPATTNGTCLRVMLLQLSDQSLSGRIATGVDRVIANLQTDGGQTSGTNAPSRSNDVFGMLLVLVPTVLAALAMRELFISVLDRRPGPVQVKTIAAAVDADNPSMPTADVLRSGIAHCLADIDLDPRPLTVGGLGEIVVPVVESSERAGGPTAAIATLLRNLLLPKSGFDLSGVVCIKDGDVEGTFELRSSRDGLVRAMFRVTAATVDDFTTLSAAHAYLEVLSIPSVRLSQPSWSRWTDPSALARFIRTDGETVDGLRSIIVAEPGNVASRLKLSSLQFRQADEALRGGSTTAAHSLLSDAVKTACGAVRLAPRLMEPRVHLALALSVAPTFVEPGGANKVSEMRPLLDALLQRRPRIGAWRLAPNWVARRRVERYVARGSFEQPAELVRLSMRICRGCILNTRLPATLWRFRRRRLRRSLPARTLVPFSPARRATIHNLRSIALYARQRELDLNASKRPAFARWSLYCRCASLRLHIYPLPESTKAYAYYNLMLIYARLTGSSSSSVRMKARAGRRFKTMLERSHFNLRDPLTRESIQQMSKDADLEQVWDSVQEWLKSVDLNVVGEQQPPAPPECYVAAQQRPDDWAALVNSAVKWLWSAQKRDERLRAVQSALIRDCALITDLTVAGFALQSKPEEPRRVSHAVANGSNVLDYRWLRVVARRREQFWRTALSSVSPVTTGAASTEAHG